jgi:hypothetical protein
MCFSVMQFCVFYYYQLHGCAYANCIINNVEYALQWVYHAVVTNNNLFNKPTSNLYYIL